MVERSRLEGQFIQSRGSKDQPWPKIYRYSLVSWHCLLKIPFTECPLIPASLNLTNYPEDEIGNLVGSRCVNSAWSHTPCAYSRTRILLSIILTLSSLFHPFRSILIYFNIKVVVIEKRLQESTKEIIMRLLYQYK